MVEIILGEFGIVYRGILKRGFSDTIGDTVAVKTLRGTLNLSQMKMLPQVIEVSMSKCHSVITYEG